MRVGDGGKKAHPNSPAGGWSESYLGFPTAWLKAAITVNTRLTRYAINVTVVRQTAPDRNAIVTGSSLRLSPGLTRRETLRWHRESAPARHGRRGTTGLPPRQPRLPGPARPDPGQPSRPGHAAPYAAAPGTGH
ncbi:hypothetical protein G6F65_019848 [Rhizopus arrhizus]|nr:hypothetical protein G6F24_018176 [Rhizopus arrhizus]KAG1248027.1 hypothetical protein G6F65_019848 [Rhizopus arrhizus]